MKRELTLTVLFLLGILMFAVHAERSRIDTCTTEGIDVSTVNTYSEWTQTDWKGTPDSDAICRKSLATMFAHFTQETGGHDPSSSIPQWRQGL